MKRRCLSNAIVAIFFCAISVKCKKNSVQKNRVSIFFSQENSSDATPVVLEEILKASQYPISEIKFEPGTYHFYPDKALEKFVHISNHNDVLVRTAMPISGMKNLTIDGQGAKFVFHGVMIPFLMENSSNITVKNLSIDWAVPFHSEALVVASDEKNRTFDIKISEEYPYEIRNGNLVFVKEYYEHSLGQTILYDPKRKAIAFDTESYTDLTYISRKAVQYNSEKIKYKYKTDPRDYPQNRIGVEQRLRAEQLEPGLVRIFNHGKKMPPVGYILTSKGEQSANRLAPAFRLVDIHGFKGENLIVHHAGGMGFIAENSSNILLDGFNVIPSSNRMVSTTADATHFVGCSGVVELRNCTFKNQLDDAMNVHGSYQEIVDVLDDYRLGVRMGHFQQKGFSIGKEGDKIGLVRLSDSFFPYDRRTIKKTQSINGRYHIISFTEKLPKNLAVGDLIENLNGYPEVLVENCTISNNRARGLLISNPVKTVVDNNYFSTEMEAILVPVESSHWFESGNAANLTIKNNVFKDCQHSGFDRGVIRFVTDDDNNNIAFKNIQITGNTFDQFDNLILEISNTDGLSFTGNTITSSNNFKKLHPKNPAIKLKSSKNITFQGNTYKGDAQRIVEAKGDMSEIQFN
ncbi:right-handed parallel beta-helix repeat-containing protein [Zobellia roscoffensis]|uniref:right-handed parallel beta-helix repeat-containing protein n=1 Tax=Zobellia roscoffensis TaxID=2779508 RepID=UPI00188BAC42